MPIPIKVKVADDAIARIARKLADLDQKIATASMRSGINEVTKVVTKDAKALTPKRTGQLRKSLGRRVKTYRQSKVVVGVVGPRSNFRVIVAGKPVNPAKYAHLVEFGRKAVKAKRKAYLSDGTVVYGKAVAAAAPRPFLRPTWAANRRRATSIVLAHQRAGVRKYLAGKAGKGGRGKP